MNIIRNLFWGCHLLQNWDTDYFQNLFKTTSLQARGFLLGPLAILFFTDYTVVLYLDCYFVY